MCRLTPGEYTKIQNPWEYCPSLHQQPPALRLTGSYPSPHRKPWALVNWQKLIKLLVIPSTDTARGLSQALARQKEDPNDTLNQSRQPPQVTQGSGNPLESPPDLVLRLSWCSARATAESGAGAGAGAGLAARERSPMAYKGLSAQTLHLLAALRQHEF